MSLNDCPTSSNLAASMEMPHGTDRGEPTDTSYTSAANDTMEGRREIADSAKMKDTYTDTINGTIGDDANGPNATARDESALRSLARDFTKLFDTASKGFNARLAAWDTAATKLGGLSTGDESLWLNICSRLGTFFKDSRSPFYRWVMIKAFDPNMPTEQQQLVMSMRSMDARINGAYDRIYRNQIKPIMQFVAPIAKRLGYDNKETAVILGDFANMIAVPEKNAELLRRWNAEINIEQAKANPDIAYIAEREGWIEDLQTYIDATDVPENLVSCGYTNAQARQKMQEIMNLGVTEAEGEQFSALMTDWAYALLEERARAGLIDPAVLQRFPRTFERYVPFQNRFDNHSGAVNETHPYNPGTYHAMEGSRTPPDSSFLTLLAYSRRAASEIGMQDFGIKLATKGLLDKANKVDNGIRVYSKRHLDRWKNDRDPVIAQWARNFDSHGGLIIDVPQFKNGTFTGMERSYICFDPNWRDPANHLDGSVLNQALLSAPKVSGGLHAMAVANSWYGQMFTRMQPPFSTINSMRDMVERSYHIAAMTTYDESGREVSGMSMLPAFFTNIPRSGKMLRDALSGNAADDSLAKKYWDEYQAMGLHQEYTPGMNSANRSMSDIIAEQNKESYIAKALGKSNNAKLRRAFNSLGRNKDTALRVLDGWNDYFNNLASFNEFVVMREHGISAERAGSNVLSSMNMTHRGTLTPVLQAFFPFVKPTMNSAAAMARSLGLVYDPRGFIKAGKNGWKYMIGTTMAYAMLQPLIQDAMGEDESGLKKMDALSLSDLARFIPIPLSNGGFIKLPTGYGPVQLPLVLVNGIDRVTRGLMTPEDLTFEMLFTTAKNMMAGNWPEFGFTEDPIDYLAQMFSPSFLSPFVQVATNRGYFGQPITYASADGDRALADQGRTTTPTVYHQMARGILEATGIDFAPEQIRALTSGLFIGPLRVLRSALEMDSQYKASKESPLLDDHKNLFIAAIKSIGAGQVLGSTQNESRLFFYNAYNYYSDKLRRSGVKITGDTYGNDTEARHTYQRNKLEEAGFTPAEADDYILLRDSIQSTRDLNRAFNDATRVTWLTANDSTELKAAITELANNEANIYDSVVQQLNYYRSAR